jgi:hypothetical protein
MKLKIKHFWGMSWIGMSLMLCSCPPQSLTPQRGYFDFFYRRPAPNPDYFTTLPLGNVDSCVRRLQIDVPPKWQGLACEGLYYRLPTNMKDSTRLRYWDQLEQTFPHDTVIAFVQLMRGIHFTSKARYDAKNR